jgi:hydrogenase/urease accessory protein HupE
VTFVGATLAGSAAGLLDVTIPGALWSVRLGTIALGLLTAASWFPPLWLAIVLGGVLGVAQGNFGSAGDSALIARPVVFSLGLGVGPILVTSWFVALADRFRARWLEIGFRVVGSWLATIAMLIASLAAARPAP